MVVTRVQENDQEALPLIIKNEVALNKKRFRGFLLTALINFGNRPAYDYGTFLKYLK